MAFKNVSFYGQGPLNAIQSDYARDPRRQMEAQLMQQGSSLAPVQSPLEGLARALTAGVGGYAAGAAKREKEGRKTAASESMQKMIAAMSGPELTAGAGSPPSAKYKGNVPGGGFEGAIAAYDGNEDTAQAVQQMQMQKYQQESAAQQAEIARQNARDDFLFQEQNKYRKQPPPKTVKTAEGVFILNPDGTKGARLGGAKAETEISLGGELSKDFRPVKDEKGNTIGAEPVPGGKEDPSTVMAKKEAERQAALNIENKEKLPARRSQIYASVQNAPAFQDAVTEAISLAKDWGTSGLMQQVTGGVAGTPAFALERALDTIKSNIGFGELLRIKESGGTLGALSEMENRLLQAMQGALDPRLDGEKLASALQKVGEIHRLNLEQKKLEFKYMYPDSPRPWEAKKGAKPADLDQAIWDAMTPEEQAIF